MTTLHLEYNGAILEINTDNHVDVGIMKSPAVLPNPDQAVWNSLNMPFDSHSLMELAQQKTVQNTSSKAVIVPDEHFHILRLRSG